MSTDLVRRSHEEELAKIGLMTLGQIFCDSGFFKDAAETPKAIVKIIAGREIGFGPMAAMSGIHVIEGKPEIGANLQAIAVRQSGRYDYRVRTKSLLVCEIEFFEILGGKRESLGIESFTIDDAKRAGLAGKPNWTRYPKNMLFARCMSNGVATFCPDAVGMRAYSEGEVAERDFDNKQKWTADETATATAGTTVTVAARVVESAPRGAPKGTVTVEPKPRQRAKAPEKTQANAGAGGAPSTPQSPPSAPSAPPAPAPPNAVAAGMGVEPGSSPLAPDENAQPIHDEKTGEVVGYTEDPDQGDAAEPAAPPAKAPASAPNGNLTVDLLCSVLGPKQERIAQALLDLAKSGAKVDAPISCDAAALMSRSCGRARVDAAWKEAGGEFDKSGVRLPLRADQVGSFLFWMLEPKGKG